MRNRRSWLGLLLLILIPLLVLLTSPWALHIGGRWTPLVWWGSGKLVAKGGLEYPLFVMLYPSSHFSRLRLDGRRPTGGVQGNACLCTAPGAFQYLKLSGTIYDGWLSTDGSLMNFRLLEPTILDVGQKRAGYFDLFGKWEGPELVMDTRGSWTHPFRSGLRMQQALVTLHWDPYWSCKSACAGVANHKENGSP